MSACTPNRAWIGVVLTVLAVASLFLLGPLLPPSAVGSSAQPPLQTVRLAFLRQGQPATVFRTLPLPEAREDAARMLLEALLAGPTPEEAANGIASAFPPSRLLSLKVHGAAITATLAMPATFLEGELDTAGSDAMVWQFVRTMEPLGFLHFHLLVADPWEPGAVRPVSAFLRLPPRSAKGPPAEGDPAPPQRDTVAGQPPTYGQGQPQGALTGKTVFLSAGHGWYWDGTAWRTQRGSTCNLVEDLTNAEAVDDFLLRYLWNAGADVWTVRERDRNPSEGIVDNDGGAPGYQESGTWYTSVLTGYLGLTYRYTFASSTESATASWIPNLPQEGDYAVYVWYRNGSNRVTDALYRIYHAGGVTEVRLNQELHGLTWHYLGTYRFRAGTSGRVVLSNLSSQPGQVVIADAVRFGGGMGSIDYGGGTSNRPRYEEACLTWARFQGAPPDVYPNDPTCRPRYAEWEKEPGEDAVYISWHSNGLTGGCNPASGNGTESYIHTSLTPPGSSALQNAVHEELIQDIRALWDPAWVDRGKKTADFAEVRELETMPGVLLEIAFHDDPYDAAALKEPDFRLIAARAVYQGIVKYFAARDGIPARLLPEPPCGVVARNSGPGRVTLSWQAPPSGGAYGDPAETYKVYVGTSGRAFDNGRIVSTTQATVEGLSPNTLYFFRVTALNAGGESFPCGTAAVRTTQDGGRPLLLLVDGFDRIDSWALIYENLPGLGSVGREYLERMNAYDYAIQHGQALASCAVPFDFASNEAVIAGTVNLRNYATVDWLLGEESTVHETFDHTEQAIVTEFLAGGGRLLVSGAEIGWDLDYRGDALDRTFYRNWLRAEYQSDDAGTYQVAPLSGGIFSGLGPFSFDDSTHGTYDVDYPDGIAPLYGATPNLIYQGGSGGYAGLQYSGLYRLLYLAFPFEAIYPESARQAVMCRAADFLVPTATPTPTPGPSPTPVPVTPQMYMPLVLRSRYESGPTPAPTRAVR